jgi:hypothetical protein
MVRQKFDTFCGNLATLFLNVNIAKICFVPYLTLLLTRGFIVVKNHFFLELHRKRNPKRKKRLLFGVVMTTTDGVFIFCFSTFSAASV